MDSAWRLSEIYSLTGNLTSWNSQQYVHNSIIHGSDVWYIGAYFCRWCGKWLEECDIHKNAKCLSGRVRNDKFRRVFRLPRVDLCQTPLYRSPVMIVLHQQFLDGLEPSQEEIDKKFNDTYVNEIREHHSITQ